jgi:ketosteroid isomerase-like protein
MTRGPADLARAALQAYADKDRAALAAILAGDYHFTSPIDNALDLDTEWKRCWPNSEKTEGFDVIHVVEDGERAFLVYEMRTNGKRFRNCELYTARDGKLIETQVYFGWDLPHKAPLGGFVENEGEDHA